MTDDSTQLPEARHDDPAKPAESVGLIQRLLRRSKKSGRPRSHVKPSTKRPGAWSFLPASLGELLAVAGTLVEIVVRVLVAIARIFGFGPHDEIDSPKRYNVTRLRESPDDEGHAVQSTRRPVVHVIVNPISGVGRSLKALPLLGSVVTG